MILHSGIILYHGSYVTVEKPELERCYPYKDFGRGFYLTTSQEQAVSFVRSSVAKAAGRGDVQPNTKWGFVSKYIFQTDINIKIHEFPNADAACCIALLRTAVPRYLLTGRLSGRITTFWPGRWPMTERTRRLQHIWQGCLEKSARCVRTNNVCRCSCRKIWKIKSVCGHLPRWRAFLLRGAKK